MGTHVELENRNSEVVGANVNEWKHDATVMGMKGGTDGFRSPVQGRGTAGSRG